MPVQIGVVPRRLDDILFGFQARQQAAGMHRAWVFTIKLPACPPAAC